jgi:uncharacterized protein YaiI (UPF0178 family)
MPFMHIFVDADACPVQEEIMKIAVMYQLNVTLVKSISHFSMIENPDHVDVVYVDKGADMADFEIMKLAKKGDLIITQDYGLASLALGKGCHIMHHKGFMYTKHNIDRLLANRHAGQMARRAGQRTKGPKAFTGEDRENFAQFLKEMLGKITASP